MAKRITGTIDIRPSLISTPGQRRAPPRSGSAGSPSRAGSLSPTPTAPSVSTRSSSQPVMPPWSEARRRGVTWPPRYRRRPGRPVGSGRGQRGPRARATRSSRYCASPRRSGPGGRAQHARFLHQLVGAELLAASGRCRPRPAGSTSGSPAASRRGAVHLGDAQVAAEQVVQHQRRRPALPAGGVGRRPARHVGRVLADVEHPRRRGRPRSISRRLVGRGTAAT